jgi:HEAT repeat protein
MPLFGPPNVNKMREKQDVPGLIKALRYEKDENVREAAAEALGALGDPRAVTPLIAALTDQSSEMRLSASEALGEIGNASAVAPLIAQLHDDVWNVRRNVIRALGGIGDPRAVEPLIELISQENDLGIMLEALNVIEAFAPYNGAAKEAIITALKNGALRGNAAEALVRLNWKPDKSESGAWFHLAKHNWDECIAIGAPAVMPVCAVLRDESMKVRQGAVKVLLRIGDARAVKALLAMIEKEPSSQIHWDACEALSKIGDPSAAQPLLHIYERRITDAISQTIIALKAPQVIEPLISLLLNASKYELRHGCAWMLARMGDQRAVEPLRQVYQNDSNPKVRNAALFALGFLKDQRALQPLLDMLASDSPEADLAKAVEALGKLGAQEAIEPLITALDKKVDPGLLGFTSYYSNIARALGEIGGERAFAILITAVQDYMNEDRSIWGAIGLSKTRDPRAIEPIISAMDAWRGRNTIFQDALTELGLGSALDLLMKAFRQSEEPEKRKIAARALGLYNFTFHWEDEAVYDRLILQALREDPKPDVRQNALGLCGFNERRLKHPEHVDAVLTALQYDPDVEVRRAAARTLGGLENHLKYATRSDLMNPDRYIALATEKVIPQLIAAQHGDPSPGVREEATNQLSQFADLIGFFPALKKALAK